MRIRGLAMSGGREVAISAVFTALLVVSILFLPSVLLTSGRLGPSSAKEWPFLAAAKDGGYYPVSFAYLISASTGDAERAARLLAALYHPANSYLLHLDREAPAEEHRRLAELVSGQPVYGRVGNVWIVGKPNLVTYRGPTMLSTTLHAMAVLLRVGRRWDWFVNLSASDYPLVTQDDLMEAFSRLPRDLNFIQHTSHLGWKIQLRPHSKPRMCWRSKCCSTFCFVRRLLPRNGRVGVDDAVAALRGVLRDGVGQPGADAAALPRQPRLLAGVLLPDGGLQLPRVPERHRQQRPAFHPVGHPAQTAPALPRAQGLPPDGAQQRRLRPQVQGRRPRARQDRPGDPQAPTAVPRRRSR
ncbi:uncharacterized protein LOC125554045 isoform X2 [Triticum urartu]|uniref:uncharacterized protein LOC125554045 isoform X2 n=1 Tax=Triticum urartu TaxID=4572 RepID=UPI0020446BC0|nr:uncharacterized protein LOC125554045 isoform X2 [Triticum urartu]